MNRHSILFKLNILFIIALLATLVAAFSMTMHMAKKERSELMFKSRLFLKEMRMTHQVPYGLLEEFQLKVIEGSDKQKVLQNAREILKNDDFAPRHMQKHRNILRYKGDWYLHVTARDVDMLLKDEQSIAVRFLTPILVLTGILFLLVLMYILLRRALVPLKKLQNDIIDYGEGRLHDYRYLNKKDEVSLASDAFYRSVEKLEKLRNSRDLFIRNLFHELNTPVTKGKLLTEIVEDTKTKEMLDSIFSRLASLLKELAQMERLTSENYYLQKKPVRIRELIDEASDLLYLEKEIMTNVSDEMISADFSLMSMVFKNLIDNALKYGKNLEISVDAKSIRFISEGEPLKQSLNYYTEAFAKGRDIETQQGFGLGLYIVNEIIRKHKMELFYEHELGQNIFIIRL